MLLERHQEEETRIIAITGRQGQVDFKQAKFGRTRRGVYRPQSARSQNLHRIQVTRRHPETIDRIFERTSQ